MSDELGRLEAQVRAAFQDTPAPDAGDLRGSAEGDEPFLLEEEFRQVPDWRQVDVAFIDRAPDGFGSALSFFSSAAFRYYLPAYLLAKLADQLQQANPLFHLWHGLVDGQRDMPVNDVIWTTSHHEGRSTWTIPEVRMPDHRWGISMVTVDHVTERTASTWHAPAITWSSSTARPTSDQRRSTPAVRTVCRIYCRFTRHPPRPFTRAVTTAGRFTGEP